MASSVQVLSTADTVDDAVLAVVSGLFVEGLSVVRVDECRRLDPKDRSLKSEPLKGLAVKAKEKGFAFIRDGSHAMPALAAAHS